MKYRTLHASEFLQNERDINIHEATVDVSCTMHTHDFIEMGFIIDGAGTHIVDNQSYHIQKVDLFLLNADVPHEFLSDNGEPLTVCNCIFQPVSIDVPFSGAKDFVDVAYHYLFQSLRGAEGPSGYIRITGAGTLEIRQLLDNIHREYQQKSPGYMQVIRSELTTLLIFVFRLYRNDREQVQSQPLFRRLVVNNALSYLQAHYAENITCRRLADRSYLSTSYFSRLFRDETGCSIIQMLQKYRMDAARELLENTVYTIEEVASRVGYFDLKHFYRIFHRHNGCTPGEYRSRLQK